MPPGTAPHPPAPPTGDAQARGLFSPRGELIASVVMGVALLAGSLLKWGVAAGEPRHAAGYTLTWLALGLGLIYGGRATLQSLATRRFDIDVLMFLGAVLAAWLNAPGEGALLLFLFTLSGALEEIALQRTQRAVTALHRLMPTAATRWQEGRWVSVPPESLGPGDRVRVLGGDSLATDAKVLSGETSMNQAALTGEAWPRAVGPGDELYAGTINVGDPIEAIVLRPAAESALQRVLNLVIEAQQQRQPVQRLIDRLSQPYAIGVTLAAALVGLVWWAVIGLPAKDAVYTAITLLIVASPCALIISTPTATLAAIARGARAGVLFKGGQAIQRLARVRAVAFDKTGTLTVGRPRVHRVYPIGWSDEGQLLAAAAGLESQSTHPIARALVASAQQRGATALEPAGVRNVAGRGVCGVIAGLPARLGSLIHTEDLIPMCLRRQVADVLERVQHRGHIAVVCVHDQSAAVFVLSDSVRPGAECLVPRLHALGVRPVVMLTGDNERTARGVAHDLRLDEFHAQLLPEDKVAHVHRLRRDQGVVGVIGDGVNDAPALAAADVAIGIGSIGSDAALESADIVLLADDLSAVPWALRLARRAQRTVLLNLGAALLAIAVMIVATLVGSLTGRPLPLWVGVIGHEGGTLLVVAHSLLLLTLEGVPACARAVPPAEPTPGPPAEAGLPVEERAPVGA